MRPNMLAPLVARALTINGRTLTTSAVSRQLPGVLNPGYIKVRENYSKFQIDNGVLIHLKGGPFDTLLYYTTVAICSYGLLLCFKVYYDLGWPKKAQ